MLPRLRHLGFLILSVALTAPAADARPPRVVSPSADSLLAARANYPAHWWAPVPLEGAPDWEILPQAAGPGEVIVSKRHELGLLSNFAAIPFTFRGRRYASLEGFWQMMLYPEGPDDPRARYPGITWSFTRDSVARMVAFEAKRAGTLAEQNMRTMGIGWVSFEGHRFAYHPARPGRHYRLIVAAMREKVRLNPKVAQALLSTGDLVLRPDHHQEPDAPAAWRYCEILMGIRAEMRRWGGSGPARQREEDRIREAVVLRWRSESLASGQLGTVKVMFLEIDGRHPIDDFLKRFAGLQPQVRRVAEAGSGEASSVVDKKTGAQGLILSIAGIRWIAKNEVEVGVSYDRANLGAAGYRYRLAKHRGSWRVTESGTVWMS